MGEGKLVVFLDFVYERYMQFSSKSPEIVYRRPPGKYWLHTYAPKAVLRDVENNGKTVCHLVTHAYMHTTKMQFPMQLNHSYLVE